MEDNNDVDIKRLLLENIHPSYLTTDKSELRVRCPYCGDSKKNKSSAHMYISTTAPFKFYCQKCNTAGVLNSQTLRDLEVYNNELSMGIIEANNTYKANTTKQYVNTKLRKLYPAIVNNEYSEAAVAYFNNRYNSTYSNEEIINKFKAITSAYTFFEANKIHPRDGQYNWNASIGFRSADNSHIIFRDISNSQAKRYYNLNLFSDEDTISSKMYNISSDVDIMKDEVNLVITEGIFDIIGVYTYFYAGTEQEHNTIFAAACGKGYNAVILHYIRMGFLNLNIIIYSDADVDISFFEDMKKKSKYFNNNLITIYYNTIEKDFGVPKDQINLRKAVI